MNRVLKNLIIVFILCLVGVGVIFFIINNRNNNTVNKSNNTNGENVVTESEEVVSQEVVSPDVEDEPINNDTSVSSPASNNASSTTLNQQEQDTYIPVTKFVVRVQDREIYVGDTTTVITTIYPDNATNPEIVYSSSNPSIATVSSDGTVTALSPGDCYITSSVNNLASGQVKVSVLNQNNTTYLNDNAEEQEQQNESEQQEQQTEQKDDSSTSSSSDQTTNSSPDSDNKKEDIKNGWYTINNKKYYYKNNTLVKDSYVDYIYLDSNGVAQDKIGDFSATLYGAVAWANQDLNIRAKATQNSKKIGIVAAGDKMTILSSENSSTKYIKIKYNNQVGYVYSNFIYINLPDVIPDMIYNISNADKSIYKTSGKSIPNVTGVNLYGFSKKYNKKIGKTTYYAPLLYPVAKQLQKAYNTALSQGYNLKIYDTYRPYDVSVKINKEFKSLYNSNKSVKNGIDYDNDGAYWGTGWFLANSISLHNRGVAIDLALTDSRGNELDAQTPMHTLDTRSVRKYNNSTANTLSKIMTSVGFETLDSEWWHFQENSYKNSVANSFKLN